MSDFKIALVYFLATNVTKAYAEVITEALLRSGCKAQVFNVTPYASRKERLPVEEFSGFIFGFPVFADFAPSVINEWIPNTGRKRSALRDVFTYGARTTGYAHFHTRELLEKANFRVQFSAEFLGRHTFNIAGWRVLPDRPDERDFAVARKFAALAIERFSHTSPHRFALQKPFGYNQILDLLRSKQKSAERGWCNPVRFVEKCRLCRKCETECPNQAFDADTGVSNLYSVLNVCTACTPARIRR